MNNLPAPVQIVLLLGAIGLVGGMSLGQLKITQEAITLAVVGPFAMLFMSQPFKRDFVWARPCMVGAVYFTFRA
jgi:uncharacterized protein